MAIKNIPTYLILLVILSTVSSCTSYKKVPYLQTKEAESLYQTHLESAVLRFQKEDILGITVNASGEPAITADFNLPFVPLATNDNSEESSVPQGYGRQTYLVNSRGEINFPTLGNIKVEGLTIEELEVYLKNELKKFLKTDPIVTIRLMNYRISVLGEVARPGQYSVFKNHINVLEALTLAGDMSIYGSRDNIKLVRNLPNGEMNIIQLDITNPEITKSPYFYLRQDDVVYVEPNKTRAKASGIGSETSILISIGSMLLTVVNLIVLIVK